MADLELTASLFCEEKTSKRLVLYLVLAGDDVESKKGQEALFALFAPLFLAMLLATLNSHQRSVSIMFYSFYIDGFFNNWHWSILSS